MARGLGAFLEGAMSGYAFGENIKDKKEDRARRDRLDTVAEEDRQRTYRRQDAQDAWTSEDRAHTRSERARVADDREFVLGVYRDGAARADDAMAADQPVVEGRVSTRGAPQPQQDPAPQAVTGQNSEPTGVIADVISNDMKAETSRQIVPPGRSLTGRGTREATDYPYAQNSTDRRAGNMSTAPKPVQPEVGASVDQPADPVINYTFDEWKGMTRSERESAGLPVSVIGGQMHYDRLMAGVSGKDQPVPDQTNMKGSVADEPIAQPTSPGGLSAPDTSTGQRPRGVPNVGTPEERKKIAADTIKMLADTANPSGAAMADVLADQPDSNRGTPEANSQRTAGRVAKEWMDYYEAEGMPYVAEQFARRGMIEEARQFDAWSREASTRAGMEAYGRAAYWASQGNFDEFGNSVVELYNSSGYFDDEMTIDTERSEFIRDEEGNIEGARIVLEDSDGNDVVQTWESLDEMVGEVLNMFAPEKAFELHLGQMAQAGEIRAAANERGIEREEWLWKKMAELNLKGDEKERVAKVAEEIAKDLTSGWSEMSPEEKIAAIAERIQIEDAAAASLAGGATTGAGSAAVPAPMRRPGA